MKPILLTVVSSLPLAAIPVLPAWAAIVTGVIAAVLITWARIQARVKEHHLVGEGRARAQHARATAGTAAALADVQTQLLARLVDVTRSRKDRREDLRIYLRLDRNADRAGPAPPA